MKTSLITIAYIAASALFILSLGGLSQQETARRGNLYGIIGMLLALVATAFGIREGNYAVLAAALIPGLVIGAILASRVQMTSMPELVAALHSFVGLAAVLVGFATYLGPQEAGMTAGEHNLHIGEIFIGVCIGSVTFTGSVIAFLKLRGSIGGKPFMIPGRHLINLAMLIGTIVLGVYFFMLSGGSHSMPAAYVLLAATIVTGILG